MSNAPLLGIPGKVKTLLDRLTATRAAALDEVTSTRMARLDANVSAAAQASSYTGARAANLDNCDSPTSAIKTVVDANATAISAIPTTNIRRIWRGVKGLGDTTLSPAITDLQKTFVVATGYANDVNIYGPQVYLKNTTTITLTSGSYSAGAIRYEVIEFY